MSSTTGRSTSVAPKRGSPQNIASRGLKLSSTNRTAPDCLRIEQAVKRGRTQEILPAPPPHCGALTDMNFDPDFCEARCPICTRARKGNRLARLLQRSEQVLTFGGCPWGRAARRGRTGVPRTHLRASRVPAAGPWDQAPATGDPTGARMQGISMFDAATAETAMLLRCGFALVDLDGENDPEPCYLAVRPQRHAVEDEQ